MISYWFYLSSGPCDLTPISLTKSLKQKLPSGLVVRTKTGEVFFHSLWGKILGDVHPLSLWSNTNTLQLFQRNCAVFYMNSAGNMFLAWESETSAWSSARWFRWQFLKDREASCVQLGVHSLIAFDYQAMAFLDMLAMLLPMPQIQAQCNFLFQPREKEHCPFGTLWLWERKADIVFSSFLHTSFLTLALLGVCLQKDG